MFGLILKVFIAVARIYYSGAYILLRLQTKEISSGYITQSMPRLGPWCKRFHLGPLNVVYLQDWDRMPSFQAQSEKPLLWIGRFPMAMDRLGSMGRSRVSVVLVVQFQLWVPGIAPKPRSFASNGAPRNLAFVLFAPWGRSKGPRNGRSAESFKDRGIFGRHMSNDQGPPH